MARVYAMNVQEQIERTRQVIHRYFSEVWNEGRLQVLDELLTPDYINHSPSTPDPERGPRGLKPIVAAMRVGIPDLHYTILDAVLEPDKAAVHVRLTGTHTGELFGMAPTNRSIDVRQMRIEWLRDGRITQELDLLRQLGLDGAAGSGDPTRGFAPHPGYAGGGGAIHQSSVDAADVNRSGRRDVLKSAKACAPLPLDRFAADS